MTDKDVNEVGLMDKGYLDRYNVPDFFNKCWFIERKSDENWLTDNHEYTNDPLMAKRFKSELQAISYMIKNHLLVENKATEHEFI